MAKYRKKPIVIDAEQYTGNNAYDLLYWIGQNHDFNKDGLSKLAFLNENGEFIIKTLEGYHKADVEDFIIKGIAGEFYPCKPDIFQKTYELVE